MNPGLIIHRIASSAGFFCVAALCYSSVATAQTTTAATQQSVRTQDELFADIQAAHQRFNAAVSDPADISDPVRRKAIAPKAIEPLRTLINDFQELATVQPRMKRRASQVQLQFMGFLSVLGDQPTIDQLQTMSISKDAAQSLRAQSSQLLAKWVLAGKDAAAQSQLTDQVQSLDEAHPDSEDLTFLTVTLSQSTMSSPLQKRLMGLATSMHNPVADSVRHAMPTTKP